ncbi:MAG: NADH-quinone oxidoreductase subunit J [Trueperaceae bacterium]
MIGFVILAAVMIIGAIGVVTLREPVHAALSLVATLLTLAVTYITLQAHFLAAVQVIVYAGAIMVLFLFVIMLLNVGSDDSGTAKRSQLPGLRPAAYLVSLLAAAGIAATAFLDPRQLPTRELIDVALAGGGADRVGESLFSDFVLAFQLVGVLLLTGIIGAVGLVQRRAAGDRPHHDASEHRDRELTNV